MSEENIKVIDGEVVITTQEERVSKFSKGQIENYLNEAKDRKKDAELDIAKWEELDYLLK